MSTEFHALRVRSVVRDSEDAVVLDLEIPAGVREAFSFLPGQHLTLRGLLGGQDVRRSYSICGDQGQGLQIDGRGGVQLAAARQVPGPGRHFGYVRVGAHAASPVMGFEATERRRRRARGMTAPSPRLPSRAPSGTRRRRGGRVPL